MRSTLVQSFKRVGNLLHRAGPYLLIELVLPGGTLFALLLFLCRRRQRLSAADAAPVNIVVDWAIDRLRGEIVFIAQPLGVASLWRGHHRERDGLEALATPPTF